MRFVRCIELAPPIRDLFEAAEPSRTSVLGKSRCLLAFPKVSERMTPQAADWKDAGVTMQANRRTMSAWPADRIPNLKVSVVGTWTAWLPQKMQWQGGAFMYPVVMGSNGWESFQLLVNESWDEVLYPSKEDASHWEKDWAICGPDDRGHGKNWQIGKGSIEKGIPGLRFIILVALSDDGRVSCVRWRPL